MTEHTGYFLGIDCGTQGTKAVVFDAAGVAHGRGYAKHELVQRESGAREQDPQWWVEALRDAARAALAGVDASKVVAIGVSGQQHGLVVLDAEMNVIRPAKLWNDTETAPENAELVARLGGPAESFRRTGMIPLTGYMVSKLLWLKAHEPENFARIRHILLPHEYLNWWLTGIVAAEPGDASGTGFFDVRTRTWNKDVLELVDRADADLSDTGSGGALADALPPLIASDALVGTLRPGAASQLGLLPSCVVSAGGGDNMMGAIGTGNVREGVVTLSLGTSSTVYSYRDAPVLDATGTVAPFCSSSGGWLPLVCTMNATNVVTSTLHLLGLAVADIEHALSTTRPGAEGLIMLPFLNGERTPDLPTARGSLVGLSANNWRPACLIRAAVEGVSFGVLAGLDLILAGASAERILVIGGGARSAEWRQLLADATGAQVDVPSEEEAGCLGAALQAIRAVDVAARGAAAETFAQLADRCVQFEPALSARPRSELRAAYDDARARYREELERLYAV